MASLYDIYVDIQTADDTDIRLRPFSFGDHPTQYMAGFYKTIIKWVKCLLTSPGSDLSDRSYGTGLGASIEVNQSEFIELRDLAVISINAATDKIKSYQQEDSSLEDEELLAGARLLEFKQDAADSVTMTVQLTNVANTLMFLRLPLDVVKTRV